MDTEVPVIDQPFGEFDFAFLDGDHNPQTVVENVLLVAYMMPRGGTIMVHDAISHYDVVPALQAVNSSVPHLQLESINGQAFHRAAERVWDIPAAQPAAVERALLALRKTLGLECTLSDWTHGWGGGLLG